MIIIIPACIKLETNEKKANQPTNQPIQFSIPRAAYTISNVAEQNYSTRCGIFAKRTAICVIKCHAGDFIFFSRIIRKVMRSIYSLQLAIHETNI